MKGLTSRERLERCYRHEETDRPGLYLRGVTAETPRHPSYEPVRRLIVEAGDLKFGWDPSGLVAGPATSVLREPHSAEFERVTTVVHTPAGDLRTVHLAGLQGQPGMCEEHLLKTAEDAERYLSLPAAAPEGPVESFFARKGEAGDRGIVEVNLGMNPAGHVAELFGSA